eukprot:COSAG02_NODE_38683_length_426_cov_0.795107_1_plen_53_part_10
MLLAQRCQETRHHQRYVGPCVAGVSNAHDDGLAVIRCLCGRANENIVDVVHAP